MKKKKKIITVQITFPRTSTERCFDPPALLAGRGEIETISLSAEVKNTLLARRGCQLYANVVQQKQLKPLVIALKHNLFGLQHIALV